MAPPLDNSKNVEAEIRAALAQWAKRIERNPVPDFAEKISIVSVVDKTAYAGFLRCLFDVRTGPVDKILPYRPDAPPPVSAKEDPWSLPVAFSKQFLEQEATATATDRTEPEDCGRCSGDRQPPPCDACQGAKTVACDACSAKGRKSCPACRGRGIISCEMCGATGKVVQSVAHDGTRIEDVCPQCTGKKGVPCRDCADAAESDCVKCGNARKMTCPKCAGLGTPVCSQCGGTRKVVRGFSYEVAYRIAYYRSVVRDPDTPAEVFPADPPLGKLGETVLELEVEDAAAFETKKPAGRAGESFARVLAMVPAAGLGPNSKRILHSLSVEKIPIWQVAYKFEDKEYHVWICRYENRVFPVEDPFAALAGRWASAADEMLKSGDLPAFAEQVAKLAAVAPQDPAVEELKEKGAAAQKSATLLLGIPTAAALAAAIPSLLSSLYASPNRVVPLAGLGGGILAFSTAAVWWLRSRLAAGPLLPTLGRSARTIAAAAAGAVLPVVVFLALSPVHRLDVAEFEKKISDIESRPLESLTPADDETLTQLIKDYAPRGVDTAAAKNLLDAHANFVAAARAEALRQEEAARELARKQAEAARLRAQAEREEAARIMADLAAKKRAAAKRAALKKKKKKKTASS